MPIPKIDVNFVNPFVEGAIHTLKIQCSIAPKPGKLFMKGNGPAIPIALNGVVQLKSAVFNGTISLCFPEPVFLFIMEKMFGETYSTITKDLEDGAGELLNIIFGHAKKILNEKGYAIQKALPSIFRGSEPPWTGEPGTPTLILPFETERGIFHIEIRAEA